MDIIKIIIIISKIIIIISAFTVFLNIYIGWIVERRVKDEQDERAAKKAPYKNPAYPKDYSSEKAEKKMFATKDGDIYEK